MQSKLNIPPANFQTTPEVFFETFPDDLSTLSVTALAQLYIGARKRKDRIKLQRIIYEVNERVKLYYGPGQYVDYFFKVCKTISA